MDKILTNISTLRYNNPTVFPFLILLVCMAGSTNGKGLFYSLELLSTSRYEYIIAYCSYQLHLHYLILTEYIHTC
jgi:hypothetical protein